MVREYLSRIVLQPWLQYTVLMRQYSSIGRISEMRGVKIEAPGGWGWFCIKITFLWCTLTPFWSNFITGWKWTTVHKMVHFAMLQTTKYYFLRWRRSIVWRAYFITCAWRQRHVMMISPGCKDVSSDSTSDNTSAPYQNTVSIGGQSINQNTFL